MRHVFILLIYICCFIVTLSLGGWQLKRMVWKENIITYYNINITKPEQLLPDNLDDNAQFLPVILQGEFTEDQFLYYGTYTDNNISNIGYYIYAIFTLNDGRKILVNRGWIPENYKNTYQKLLENDVKMVKNDTKMTKNIQEIAGILLKTTLNKSYFLPKNDYKNHLIYNIDLEEIGNYLNIKLLDMYLIENNKNAKHGEYPIAKKFVPNFHNFHLMYAITWFALAFIAGLFIINFLYRIKNIKH